MWARRCGAPPQWPSRVKVLLQSFASAAVGLAVFNYMANADAGYLDLTAPQSTTTLCMQKGTWPLRHSLASWFDPKVWDEWGDYRRYPEAFIETHRCTGATRHTNAQCLNVDVPLNNLDNNLAVVLGQASDSWIMKFRHDGVEVYGYLFLYFSVALWLLVTIHDLGLLSERYRHGIYDFRAIRNKFRCASFLYTAWGFRVWKRLLRGGGCKLGRRRCCLKLGRIFGIVFAPVFLAWFVLAYNFIVMPLATLYWLVYPVRLSRIVLFLSCLAVGVYGVALSVHAVVWMGSQAERQQYAVLWESPADDGSLCECGCIYPMKGSVCGTLFVIGVGVAYKAFTLAFRCLKGLRRASWANLMSVLLPVPLNVYEVFWTQPDGGPIRHRVEGQPVQGELAFDAFALMDEQPESAGTTVNLMPSSLLQDFEPSTWSVEDVVRYLQALHLRRYGSAVREHGVDGPTLLQLMRLDGLSELGITSKSHDAKIRERLGTWSSRSGFGDGLTTVKSMANKRNSSRAHASPKTNATKEVSEKYRDREFIACCGFPCLKGEDSRKGVVADSDEDEDGSDTEGSGGGLTPSTVGVPTERKPVPLSAEVDLSRPHLSL